MLEMSGADLGLKAVPGEEVDPTRAGYSAAGIL